MSKPTPPADDLRPEETYQDNKQTYHFNGQICTVRIETDQNGWMYTIPAFGISAGTIRVNGVRIGMDKGGHLHVGAYDVTHKPNVGPFGLIDITARNQKTGEVPY